MKTYSTDLRQKIIETKIETQETDQKIAERFRVSRSFVNKLVRQYKERGDYHPLPRGGGAQSKLTRDNQALIIQLVEEDNDATLEQLQSRFREKTEVNISISTICRFLQKEELTRKKKTLKANEATTERVQILRRKYWMTIEKVQLSDLVFLDETGINLAMTCSYARAKKGRRAYNKCPYNRGQNVTLIGAISASGFLAPFIIEGWTDKEAFLTYVIKILVPQLWSGACVVMDNLTAHKAEEVRKAIESVGARIVFLSPYSPDFNPIENCWSKLKQYLKSQESRTYAALDRAIAEALNLVSNNDIIGWFTHCCYYAPLI